MEDGSMNNITLNGMKYILYLFGLLALALPAQSASFDCAKAATKIEKLICGDDEISKLDDALSKTYQKVLERNDDKQKATKEQRQWLKEVRNACQNVECLKTAYRVRISKLDTITEQTSFVANDNTNAVQAMPPKQPTHQKTSLCTPASRCDKVTLMYSEDDSICKPLLKVYQQLWDNNKKDKKYNDRSKAHPSFKGYWEDYYPDVFIKAGFEPPPPLRDDQHKYVPTKNSMSGEWATVFYRLRLDTSMAEQTVLLQDYPWHIHGDYSSDIYISKPGEDISTRCSLDYFAQFMNDFKESCGLPKHNQLAFATDFNDGGDISEDAIPRAETLIRGKYYFSKANTAKEFSQIWLGEIGPGDIGINGGGDSLIQRVYLFHNQPIFTARNTNRGLVYRIKNGSQMNDVCYFATNVAKISH
jgi:uncharacterized protein YecT (DUF1311 family)